VLDPAAGRCEFINAIPAAERWAVDTVDHGEFRHSGIKAMIASIQDAELPQDHFDGVFVSNFLEHLPTQDAIADVLAKLRAAMEPGGRLTVLGPNFRYCAREYFDCADHTIALTHVAVAEHLYAAGFEVTTIVPRFLPYSFRGVLPPSPRLTRIYLRVPALWRVLGKQFLVLGVRPR
jgi:SAM-dependent methyltransferase